MSHTTKDLGIHGYKTWLNSLKPLDNGTVILFKSGYTGSTKAASILPNQKLIIKGNSLSSSSDAFYDMVLFHNNKEYKKKIYFSVETIARWLIDGECEIFS